MLSLARLSSTSLASDAANRLKISRQAVLRRVRRLIEEGLLERHGEGRATHYTPTVLFANHKRVNLPARQGEDDIFAELIGDSLSAASPNVRRIVEYAATEMINNAIDHSEAQDVSLLFESNSARIVVVVQDDGVGIFEKIYREKGLESRQQALLELTKGKLTTDPTRHSGEGIFFTSKAVDTFWIHSSGLDYFARGDKSTLTQCPLDVGTSVYFEVSQYSGVSVDDLFAEFASSENEMTFDRTIVPVRIAGMNLENVVSRSQARRLLLRFDRFKQVILDFDGIDSVGQAFADEMFRVFARRHPEVSLIPINMKPPVQAMVLRAMFRFSLRPVVDTGQLVLPLFEEDANS